MTHEQLIGLRTIWYHAESSMEWLLDMDEALSESPRKKDRAQALVYSKQWAEESPIVNALGVAVDELDKLLGFDSFEGAVNAGLIHV